MMTDEWCKTHTAMPSSRRRVDGMEVMIRRSAAKFDVYTGIGAILEKEFPYIRKTPCISSVGGTSWVKDRSAAAREGMTA